MPAPLRHMDKLCQIEFTDALAHLQGLIGSEIKASVNFSEQFFGCGLRGTLDRVETLPPDHSAISLVLEDTQGIFLDPAGTQSYVGSGPGDAWWLEFRIGQRISVVVELADQGGE
jgi:hypothetical protein